MGQSGGHNVCLLDIPSLNGGDHRIFHLWEGGGLSIIDSTLSEGQRLINHISVNSVSQMYKGWGTQLFCSFIFLLSTQQVNICLYKCKYTWMKFQWNLLKDFFKRESLPPLDYRKEEVAIGKSKSVFNHRHNDSDLQKKTNWAIFEAIQGLNANCEVLNIWKSLKTL